jgi:hypothetical protein
MTQDNLKNWDAYTSNFLKTTQVMSEGDAFVVILVEEFSDARDGSVKVRLTLQRGEAEYLFDLNKTNATFLKNNGIKSPISLTGKKVYFKKVQATNPKTKTEVESLRILKVE